MGIGKTKGVCAENVVGKFWLDRYKEKGLFGFNLCLIEMLICAYG